MLESAEPYRAYASISRHAYPAALRPPALSSTAAARPAFVHPDARLEDGVCVEPGAVVGARAEIGRGTVVAAGAIIGEAVAIGRDCFVGAQRRHPARADRQPGDHPSGRPQSARTDLGSPWDRRGHLKVPQIGRVIIQDDVEIGANTTIDRGANRDTVVGEGTKIDNQVQIGHNVEIGRHCIIVAQVGISGSARLGDFVAIGGQSGVNGHVHIGDGAQIAAVSVVHDDVPAGRALGRRAGPAGEGVVSRNGRSA